MALLAARRASALLRRPTPAASAAARFSSTSDDTIAYLHSQSRSILAETTPARSTASSLRDERQHDALLAKVASFQDEATASRRAEADAYRATSASLRAEADSYRATSASLRAESDALRAEADSYRATSASLRAESDALRTAAHDGDIVRAIGSLVQSHHQGLQVDEIPSDFPFKISKKDGLTDITLTRSLKGEQIEVLASMPTLEDDDNLDYTVPLTVTVSKLDGSSLEFDCTAYHDRFVIDALSMKQPPLGDEEDEDAVASGYEDDDLIASVDVVEFEFSELDERQQRALYKYLEQRGITPVNTKILHEQMVSKDRRRHLLWMNKLWDFVKKD